MCLFISCSSMNSSEKYRYFASNYNIHAFCDKFFYSIAIKTTKNSIVTLNLGILVNLLCQTTSPIFGSGNPFYNALKVFFKTVCTVIIIILSLLLFRKWT